MDIFVERTNSFNAIFMAGTSIELSGFVIPRSSITLCCPQHKDDKDYLSNSRKKENKNKKNNNKSRKNARYLKKNGVPLKVKFTLL